MSEDIHLHLAAVVPPHKGAFEAKDTEFVPVLSTTDDPSQMIVTMKMSADNELDFISKWEVVRVITSRSCSNMTSAYYADLML